MKKKKSAPDRFAPLRARYAKSKKRLNKNIRVQLFNKAIREGWIFDKTLFTLFYSFNSPNGEIRMTIEIETAFLPHKVNFFDNRTPYSEIALIAEVSYKYYLRHGSEMILVEALM